MIVSILSNCRTQMLEYSLMIASVISIGHISTEALAASTLGSMTASVSGLSIIHGFASALDSLLPQAWTSGRPQHVGLWTQRMMLLMSVILIVSDDTFLIVIALKFDAVQPILAIWLNAEWILLRLKQEPVIAHLAGVYLRWFSLSLPGQAVSIVLRYVSYINSHVRLYTWYSQPVLPSPGAHAYPHLDHGHNCTYQRSVMLGSGLGPETSEYWVSMKLTLGKGEFNFQNCSFIGAPIASSISFNLMAIILIVYAKWFIPQTASHPVNRKSFQEIGRLFRLGLSGTGQIASEWWSWEFVALAASQ